MMIKKANEFGAILTVDRPTDRKAAAKEVVVRKSTSVVLVVVLVMAFTAIGSAFSPSIASADVVDTYSYSEIPEGGRYPLERTVYVANGIDGYITWQLRPGEYETTARLGTGYSGDNDDIIKEGSPLPTVQNGEQVFLDSYSGLTEVDGVYWGASQVGHGIYFETWVRMDQLLVVYTSSDFVEANRESIYELDNSGTSDAERRKYDLESIIEPDVGTVFWEWPGSDREKIIMEEGTHYMQCRIRMIYTDPHGNEWGFIHVNQGFYGFSGWVCLDDPKNSDITAFNPEPTPQRWAPDATYDWTIGQVDYPNPINPIKKVVATANRNPHILVLAVAGAALATFIILLVINWHAKKNKQKQKYGG